jgi:hypothetical protein
MSLNKFKLIIPVIVLTPFISLAADTKTYQVIIGVPDIHFYNGETPPVKEPEEPVIPEEPEEDLTSSSCKGLLSKDPSLTNGIQTIKYNGSDISVYCDMSNGGWTLVGRGIQMSTANWSNPAGIASNPASSVTYKLPDAVINSIPKNTYKTIAYGRYAGTRYFSGECSYSSNVQATGICLTSYSNETLSAGYRQGQPHSDVAGLSDFTLPSSLYIATQYIGASVTHGWGAGNTNPGYSGTGIAGDKHNIEIWVK